MANDRTWTLITRIRDILLDETLVNGALYVSANDRVKKITRAFPTEGHINVDQTPEVFIYQTSKAITDEHQAQQGHFHGVVLTLITEKPNSETSMKMAYKFSDELEVLAFQTYRQWKRDADASLNVVETEPDGETVSAPWKIGENEYVFRCDIPMSIDIAVENFGS